MTDSTKRIAVIYYSQSGQLRNIIDNLLTGLTDDYHIDFLKITPEVEFPFPWNAWNFFDKMPECVLEKGGPVHIEGHNPDKDYDLIIFGYQPWCLSPSLPTTGFFQNEKFHSLFKNKKVITVIGARNMWLNAQEKVKKHLNQLGAQLVGNIVFIDTMPNIISTITVIRWAFTGKKEKTRWLPQAGVQPSEIERAPSYGKLIDAAFETGDWESLQKDLIEAGAVPINPQLVLLEQTGISQFRKWAKKISNIGPPGDIKRKPLVMRFKNTLFVGIFFLSPLNALLSKIKVALNAKRLSQDVVYFSSVQYKENAI